MSPGKSLEPCIKCLYMNKASIGRETSQVSCNIRIQIVATRIKLKRGKDLV